MSQKQGKKTTPAVDIDTAQMKAMRVTVVEQELSARSWKAYYEKMYYALEAEKIEPEYKAYQERAKLKMEEDRKKMEEFMKALNEEVAAKNEADPNGNVVLEEATN